MIRFDTTVSDLCVANARAVEEAQQVEEREPRYQPPVDLAHELLLVDVADIDVRVEELGLLLADLTPTLCAFDLADAGFLVDGGGRRGRGFDVAL